MGKNYQNEKLKQYLEKYVSKMQIDDKFKPYIVDILMRRAYQYSLLPHEIKKDVDRLRKSLVKIEIVDSEKLGVEWAAAEYAPNTRTISISKETVKNQDNELLYQTLTHEVYHALSHEVNRIGNDNYIRDCLGGTNKFSQQYNNTLLETLVEKASYKTVFGTETNNAYYNQRSSRGYRAITFSLDAIEAVYGVNEQALLRNGIQDRTQLARFLGESIGEDTSKTMDFLDKLEMNLSQIHRALYPPKGEVLSPEMKADLICDGLRSMKQVCMEKMKDRIFNFQNLDKRELESVAFDFNKLNAIFDERTAFFDGKLKNEGIQSNIIETINQDGYLQSFIRTNFIRISDLNKVYKNKDRINPKVSEIVFGWAKNGTLSSYDDLAEEFVEDMPERLIPLANYGIAPTSVEGSYDRIDVTKEFNMSANRWNELIRQKNDAPQFTEPWDNSNIMNIKKVFKPKIKDQVKDFFNKVKNTFRFKKEKQHLLPEGQQEIIFDENDSFDSRYRVNEDVQKNVISVGRSFSESRNENNKAVEDFEK